MMDAVRVLLVDPIARSRQSLQKLFEMIGGVEVVEVCPAYQNAIPRIATLAPDIALVVVEEDDEPALSIFQTIAQSHPGVNLVAAGSDRDAGMILRTVRAGAREFLPLPTTLPELTEMVRHICPRREEGAGDGTRGPQVIAVTGAAGGVGCSSLSVNLATTLAKLSRCDTVLADFDLLFGSLEESLAVIADNSLEAVVRNLDDMDSALLKRWLPRHRCGLYVLPHPVSMEEAAHLDPESLRRVLDLLCDTFATVVIDTSKGLQMTDFLAFEYADVILVVLQLTLNCTRNTVRLMQYLRQYEGLSEKVRLVVNRVNSPLSEISLKKAEGLMEMPVRWQIPNSTKLFYPARTQGLPIDEVDGGTGSKTHEAFLEMAQEFQPFPVEQAKGRRTLFKAFTR
jgi:pilus assembly protein CpaE